jgi:plasmid stabilization system protein ParE
MKVVLDARAVEDIEHIFQWIEQDDRGAARGVTARIFASIERLGAFPELGRRGRVEDTREWVVPRLPYIIVYEIRTERDELAVIGVFHGAQRG